MAKPELTKKKSWRRESAPNNRSERVSDRIGICKECGSKVELKNAKEREWDWDGTYAYPYYCPNCYIEDNIYAGELLGSDDKPIIDQVTYTTYYD